MSPPTKHILLFGDQSVETLSGIQALVRNSKKSPMARRFLQEATDVIQLESSRLNSQEHGWDKPFDSLLGLAEDNNASSGPNTIVSTVLMCVGRLGQLIIGAENDPTILGSSSNPIEIVALCGGLLPAAAAVAAKDTSELFGLSRLIISVAFRLAAEVQRRAELVEGTGHSWGRTYIGLERDKAQEVLDRFHAAENIPLPRQVAIGVVADSWLTLVGPPSSLQRLVAWSPEIGGAPSLETNVPGPIHSSCLPTIDTSKIVGASPLLKQAIDNGPAKKARLYSPGSCKEYTHSTLSPLLEEMVEDIAHNVLHVSKVIQDCVDLLDRTSSYKLSVMGQTNHLAAMKKALKLRGILFETTDPLTGTEETAEAGDATRGGSDLIAVVGMSGRFPGSDSVEAFWEDLVAGKCQVQEIPKSRFDLDTYFDPTGEKKNSTAARHGCFLDRPGMFDHRLFNISPREAAQMDPAHRLLLTIGYEALQQAGYNPQGSGSGLASGSSRIATYFGQAADEWQEILNQKGADIYYVPGFSRAFGPARLHYQYKWSGPSYALDSACSTSATAVSLACDALTARECDTALAGGASVLTSPNTFSGLSRAGMLSTTGGCKTYHDDADGYCRAEGAGVVVLKRLEDALRENDNVLAVIRGSARTYSAAASSMTHPSAEAQEDTYHKVLRQSCLSADEIAYVEMHGTGTQAGDFEEMASVSCLSRNRTRDNPLTVGAVKAAVGHGEGASAVTSLIKVIMMLRERQVPPQPGAPFTLNHKFPPLSDINIKIATKPGALKPSPRGDKKIKALVNSFDASGGNVTLAVQEPPPCATTIKPADPRGWHVVAVSARSAYSLQQNRIRLLDYLESRPETKLADLGYSTTARRIHEPLRCAYTGSSTGDILRQIRKDVQDHQQQEATSVSSGSRTVTTTRRSRNRSLIFLFTGQGSQYAGMGAHLYRDHEGFRSMLLGYQELATGMGLPKFIHLISDTTTDVSSNAEASTAQTQLAIVALEIALAQLLKAWGIMPDVVIGHSLGEYAALCVAGVLSVSDTLLLVGRRAVLMEKHLTANTYAMLATSLTSESLHEMFGELHLTSCSVACENAPSVTIASGTLQDIEILQQHLTTARGMKTKLLPVPYGFHSDQVEPILDEYQQVARGVHFGKPKVPVVSTLTAKVERGDSDSAFGPAYLTQQARHRVKFVQALEACRAAGLADDGSLWLEIGPKPVLMGLARQTLALPVEDVIPTLDSRHDNWHTISGMLRTLYQSGIQVDWPEVHRHFVPSLTLLNLPTYAFDMRDFWTPYKEPERVVQMVSVDDKMVSGGKTGTSPVPGFPTSSVQAVEDERIDGNAITATFASSMSHPSLLEAIKGHGVNGHTICPLGVFHDMALTAASYLFTRLHSSSRNNTKEKVDGEAPRMSIQAMDMTHALALSTESLDATIYVAGTYRAEDKFVEVMFTSNSGLGRPSMTHGKCQVHFAPGNQQSSASQLSPASLSTTPLFLVRARIESLRQLATTNQAHRLAKPVVYQLFSGVVSYAPIYQAIEEVVMDHSSSDAIATVKLPDNNTAAHPGKFHTNPYWTDAVLHLAGFILNSGLRYPSDIACLATGFQMWRSSTELVAGGTYTSYVCMQEPGDGGNRVGSVVTGDCYVFDGPDLVQATLGIKFLKLKKVALSTILGLSDSAPDKHMRTEQNRHHQDNKTGDSSRYTPAISETPSIKPDLEAKTDLDNAEEIIESMLAIIAAESGCTTDDMADDSRYTDLGIDSVMSITILSIVSRNLSIDLPASFFLDNETIGESKAALRDLIAPPMSDSDTQQDSAGVSDVWTPSPHSSEERAEYVDGSRTRAPSESRPSTPWTQFDTKLEGSSPYELVPRAEPSKDAAEQQLPPSSPPPQEALPALVARVKHYQGPRSNSPGTTNIFFLADETGSTFSYMYLPSLGPQTAVYGVDSPFSAAAVRPQPGLDVPGLAAAYLAAIRAEQPSGPYVLGGAASGAVLAFECARLLLLRGEEVRGLVLLDCESPTSRNNNSGGNATSDSGYGAAAPPVVKKKRVKASVAEHVNSMTAIFDAFTEPAALSSGASGIALLVLANGPEDDGRGAKWSDLIPGLQTRRLEAVTGAFLSTVNMGELGSVISEALV